MSIRRQPERTCVGCRRRAAKGELRRVVRRPDGRIEADPSGGLPGRGAYVHAGTECVTRAIRTGTLARALRAELPDSGKARLVEVLMEGTDEG